EDWKTEYLDYVLSIKVVDGLEEAIDHINAYGSGHTDVIITANERAAMEFMDLVDSGDVFWNCSTRFSDGFRYGLGAEVGISTNKIHARGPVGLEGLVIYKYKLVGSGQTVADYAEGRKKFTHRRLDRGFPL
ncbi:MAG TPA: aldehyde dehydrogenase family protein, partial [Spirochaetota bacterium]|nr:aldehyde dehydrogenase family protein [Spirochaetota bacterium]